MKIVRCKKSKKAIRHSRKPIEVTGKWARRIKHMLGLQ
jgi:hypothetical protein